MTISVCKYCEVQIKRNGNRAGVFCSLSCKGEWQKTTKPVDKGWLIQKYIIEELSIYDIAGIVNRNPKQVYEWLKGYNIPTRTRADAIMKHSHHHLVAAGLDTHPMLGVRLSQAAKDKISKANTGNPGLSGDKNPMFGRRGESSPNWKGGGTPERQRLYESSEWRNVRLAVFIRDQNRCRRCKTPSKGKCIKRGNRIITNMCLHHIVPFVESVELRCDANNLILLCCDCHNWVHSGENTMSEYIDHI